MSLQLDELQDHVAEALALPVAFRRLMTVGGSQTNPLAFRVWAPI